MRNKLLVEKKLERLDSLINNIQFSINRGERDTALKEVEVMRDQLEVITSLIQNEDQDQRY
jgi:hypothetical protein